MSLPCSITDLFSFTDVNRLAFGQGICFNSDAVAWAPKPWLQRMDLGTGGVGREAHHKIEGQENTYISLEYKHFSCNTID